MNSFVTSETITGIERRVSKFWMSRFKILNRQVGEIFTFGRLNVRDGKIVAG